MNVLRRPLEVVEAAYVSRAMLLPEMQTSRIGPIGGFRYQMHHPNSPNWHLDVAFYRGNPFLVFPICSGPVIAYNMDEENVL